MSWCPQYRPAWRAERGARSRPYGPRLDRTRRTIRRSTQRAPGRRPDGAGCPGRRPASAVVPAPPSGSARRVPARETAGRRSVARAGPSRRGCRYPVHGQARTIALLRRPADPAPPGGRRCRSIPGRCRSTRPHGARPARTGAGEWPPSDRTPSSSSARPATSPSSRSSRPSPGLIRDEGFDLPIIGVARSGDLDSLRERARQSLAAARRSSTRRAIDGPDRPAALRQGLRRRRRDVPRASPRARARPGIRSTTWPSRRRSSARWSTNLAASGCADGARVIVEKPFGRDLASAMALNATVHEVLAEPDDLPDRPLPGQGAGPEPALLPVRQLVPGAALEPRPRRERPDQHARGVRRRRPRGVLRPGGRDPRRRPEPPAPGREPARHGAAVGRHAARRSATSSSRCSTRSARSRRADVVRGQYRGYRDVAGCRARVDRRDVRGPAPARRHLALGRRAVLHPDRQEPAGDRDRGPGRAEAAAPVGLRRGASRPTPTTSGSGSRPTCRSRSARGPRSPARRWSARPSSCSPRHQSGTERPPYQRLIGDATRGDQSLFAREDSVEAAWRVVDGILDDRAPLHDYEPGHLGSGRGGRDPRARRSLARPGGRRAIDAGPTCAGARRRSPAPGATR